MVHVFLLRHAETCWNADGRRYCGRTDLPLTEKGIRQAKAVHEKLKNISFDSVYTSPLKRASHTAQIASGSRDVITDERLAEVDFGQWEGKRPCVFIPENENLWKAWTGDPTNVRAGKNGETAGEAVARVDAFFQSLLESRKDGTVLIVGHNGINRFYLAYKLGMLLKNYSWFYLDNASVTEFMLDESGSLYLKTLNQN